MDITRNWRLKMSRTQLYAARCPETGTVILPGQTSFAAQARCAEPYVFDVDEGAALRLAGVEQEYARAAAR